MNHPLSHSSRCIGHRHVLLSFIIYHLFFIISAVFVSCVDDTSDYDPYFNWRSRNEAWMKQVADSAHRGGTDWLMFKSALKSPRFQSGLIGDSIFVHVLERGTGKISPAYSDTVRISFRGYLMPTVDEQGQLLTTIFSQTYYQGFDPATAAPQKACVASFTEGFATALQHMVEGDDWLVYIPADLFYGEKANGVIPAYSAACFRINMAAVYPLGTVVPDWK